MKRLLDRDPELVNSYDVDGKTPLHYACANGSEAFVKLLIEYEVFNTCILIIHGEIV